MDKFLNRSVSFAREIAMGARTGCRRCSLFSLKLKGYLGGVPAGAGNRMRKAAAKQATKKTTEP
jgi:hypothetical protein